MVLLSYVNCLNILSSKDHIWYCKLCFDFNMDSNIKLSHLITCLPNPMWMVQM